MVSIHGGGLNVGDVYATLSLRSSLDKDVKTANRRLESVGKKLAEVSVAGVAAAATITAKILMAGSDVEEMYGKFNAVFRENAKSVEEWADEHGDAVNRSKFDLMGYASTLQDTFVPLGFAREEGAELSKQMTELAIDLASFNNEAEPETIAALQSALVGNHETMRRYGVIITQTTLDQELLNMGIVGGIRAATEQQKVQARLNIIMQGTSDAQGDASRTAGSFANKLRGLKGDISEVMEEAGREELGDFSAALDELSAWGDEGGWQTTQDVLTGIADTLLIIGYSAAVAADSFGIMYHAIIGKFDELGEKYYGLFGEEQLSEDDKAARDWYAQQADYHREQGEEESIEYWSHLKAINDNMRDIVYGDEGAYVPPPALTPLSDTPSPTEPPSVQLTARQRELERGAYSGLTPQEYYGLAAGGATIPTTQAAAATQIAGVTPTQFTTVETKLLTGAMFESKIDSLIQVNENGNSTMRSMLSELKGIRAKVSARPSGFSGFIRADQNANGGE